MDLVNDGSRPAPPSPAKPGSGRPALAHEVFRREKRPLDPFFRPRSVALIGASETPGSVGRTLLGNLLDPSFAGAVYPVNPNRATVLGRPAFARVTDIPAAVDLAVIATPAATVPAVVADCVAHHVQAAVVISAGFGETGPAGVALERRVLAEARRGDLRLIGPNCLGVMCPPTGLNATFAAGMARRGSVAFLSQSGALLTSVLDWSRREGIGFSAFVSVGAMLDVGWGDLIDDLGDDPRTKAIIIYMESIGDARAFLAAAREVALTKPIIVIKAGRSEAAGHAAASHTGALTGSDRALDAAFRRAGVLRVDGIEEVFDLAELLSKQPRPSGRRLTILTNAGGPGVLATDALIAGGGELAPLSAETKAQLDAALPPSWSHANPIDILGDATPKRFADALEIASRDPSSDALLAILTPQAMTDPTAVAEALRAHARSPGKPMLASWMGGAQVAAGVDLLNQAGIATFAFPDAAARAFCHMCRYTDNLRALYETPVHRRGGDPRPDGARDLIARARAEGRTLLDQVEAQDLLDAYGIPSVPTRLAATEDAAVAAACQLGFPVALKLWSRIVTHKTDVGGVKLDLATPDAVVGAFRAIRAAVAAKPGAEGSRPDVFLGVAVQPFIRRPDGYELIVGSSVDAQLGPVLLFGAGGTLVEVLQDRALALPPLTMNLARRLVAETRIGHALAGVRGHVPVDLDALASLLVRFADLVAEQPAIREIEINPLLVTPDGALALDARAVLHPPGLPDAALPRSAIRPYPSRYVWADRLSDGTALRVRPIRPDDEPLIAAFHHTLGEDTVRQRYMGSTQVETRTAHERLVRVCFTDFDREIVLVAERPSDAGPGEILGVARLSRSRFDARLADLGLLVGDAWQCRGVGRRLLERLLEVAACEGVRRVHADILGRNLRMQRLCARHGFTLAEEDVDLVTADLDVAHDAGAPGAER